MSEQTPPRQYGDCYKASVDAAEELSLEATSKNLEVPDLRIVHGTILPKNGPDAGRRIRHSWIEVNGFAVEVSNQQQIEAPIKFFHDFYQATVDARYTLTRAQELANEFGYAPWHTVQPSTEEPPVSPTT